MVGGRHGLSDGGVKTGGPAPFLGQMPNLDAGSGPLAHAVLHGTKFGANDRLASCHTSAIVGVIGSGKLPQPLLISTLLATVSSEHPSVQLCR